MSTTVMRLIDIRTLQITQHQGGPPPYAILSHVWGHDEITLQEFNLPAARLKLGWRKIVNFCDAVTKRLPHISHVWIDTCCIDKTSSAELSEAINSMCAWYRDAIICYAYLADVEIVHGAFGADFDKSRWFTRGWTLQELLAPAEVEFFDKNWKFISTRTSLTEKIMRITGIEEDVLTSGNWSGLCAAHRMSWMADRETTRVEDLAYCLLGIFDINMPMIYGEGERAFIRLQEEILREYDDLSILAWNSSDIPAEVSIIGVLAPHPRYFKQSAGLESYPSEGSPLAITNRGLHVNLAVAEGTGSLPRLIATLPCANKGNFASVVVIGLVRDRVVPTKYSRDRSQPMTLPVRQHASKLGKDIVLVKKSISLADEMRELTRCLVLYPEHVQCVGVYPSNTWYRDDGNHSMTLTTPSVATSTPLKSAFAFKYTECTAGEASNGGLFSVVLLGSLSGISVFPLEPSSMKGVQMEKTLKTMAEKHTRYISKLSDEFVLGRLCIQAQLRREIRRGTWITTVTLRCNTVLQQK
ncbi:hypothetical protein QQS21_011470 [Conoideocrella luteorostrata]|uniref:Heterokaryon incompatibility domain-containing protein n=1 Tax=Conoideocrella luteorostrata TaxID=1105319 RepID=A0AAJ0FTP1_9HYPO|nr:hypothetical protein QQS21_011470 [Conoideocrella luteorostrata]